MERTPVGAYLIDKLMLCAEAINMTCNERKTVCMVFNPQSRSRTVLSSFPLLKLGTSDVQFVQSFRYLGHIVSEFLCDNEDIGLQREIKITFIRKNMLIRKFNNCSRHVKCTLFKPYCLSLYDIALWRFVAQIFCKMLQQTVTIGLNV